MGGLEGVTWQDLENDGLAYIGQPGTNHMLLVLSSLMGTQVTAVCMQCQSVRLPSVLGATSDVPACNIGLVSKVCLLIKLLPLVLWLGLAVLSCRRQTAVWPHIVHPLL